MENNQAKLEKKTLGGPRVICRAGPILRLFAALTTSTTLDENVRIVAVQISIPNGPYIFVLPVNKKKKRDFLGDSRTYRMCTEKSWLMR